MLGDKNVSYHRILLHLVFTLRKIKIIICLFILNLLIKSYRDYKIVTSHYIKYNPCVWRFICETEDSGEDEQLEVQDKVLTQTQVIQCNE